MAVITILFSPFDAAIVRLRNASGDYGTWGSRYMEKSFASYSRECGSAWLSGSE